MAGFHPERRSLGLGEQLLLWPAQELPAQRRQRQEKRDKKCLKSVAEPRLRSRILFLYKDFLHCIYLQQLAPKDSLLATLSH